MNIQPINLGLSANDNTGDPLRVGGFKINDNFRELFNFNVARHRQALLIYKTIDDQPSFLYNSTGRFIDLCAPVVGSIGAGIEQRGERTRPVVITSDELSAWNLADNEISYLYIESNSLSGDVVYGVSLLEPIVSQLAPVSSVEGQHWYNPLLNQISVYNGYEYEQVYRLFVAEITTFDGIVVDINYYTSNEEYEYVNISTNNVLLSCNSYTDQSLTSSYNYTDLQTSATLISSNDYSIKSAMKYALVLG